jgi:hypothetical protein
MDDFYDGLAPSMWEWQPGYDNIGSVVVDEVGGRMTIELNAGGWFETESTQAWEMLGQRATIEVVTAPSSAGEAELLFGLRAHNGERLHFNLYDGGLYIVSYSASWAFQADDWFKTYDPAADRFWGLRLEADGLYADTSADGVTWIERGSWSLDATSGLWSWPVSLEINAGSESGNPGVVVLDNLNVFGVKPSPGHCSIETLVDDLSGGAATIAPEWRVSHSGDCDVSRSGGKLHMGCDGAGDGVYVTRRAYDVRSGVVFAETTPPTSNIDGGPPATVDWGMFVAFPGDPPNYVSLRETQGTLSCATSIAEDVCTLDVSLNRPDWWRIQFEDSAVRFSTSSNGTMWTVRGTASPGFDYSQGVVGFSIDSETSFPGFMDFHVESVNVGP